MKITVSKCLSDIKGFNLTAQENNMFPELCFFTVLVCVNAFAHSRS